MYLGKWAYNLAQCIYAVTNCYCYHFYSLRIIGDRWRFYPCLLLIIAHKFMPCSQPTSCLVDKKRRATLKQFERSQKGRW